MLCEMREKEKVKKKRMKKILNKNQTCHTHFVPFLSWKQKRMSSEGFFIYN
jgi:hypothetical protein